MSTRTPFQGAWTVLRFNWPYYVLAAFALIVGLIMIILAEGWSRWLGVGILLATLWFLLGSLGVTHFTYDCSELYRWTWLDRILQGLPGQRFVLCHTGFDDASASMKEYFPEAEWIVLDHYHEATMSEPSIRRARRAFPPPPDTIAAPHDRWPVPDQSVDAVIGFLAIHELRSLEERAQWSAEARRVTRPEGVVLIVEHVRDFWNFLAYGPGFFHFHAPAEWARSWEAAGWQLAQEQKIGAWVRVFLLKKKS